jgi:hypothetical protein
MEPPVALPVLIVVISRRIPMNAQSHNRYPKGVVAAALLVLVAVISLSATGPTGAGPVPAAPGELVWVRQDDPIINVNNDPTFWEAPEGDRFDGSFWEYIVDETAIIYEERYVDHGYEYYHITLRSEFDRPPLVVNPPLRYKLTARAGHAATKAEGAEGLGFQFWYDSDYAAVEPREVLAYYPWSPHFTGQNSKDWMLTAPPPQPGQSFKVWASWWNCPPCNVIWTYMAEPATAVEQLGVEVVQPVVEYQGAEVPPGEIFFPETCALPDGTVNPCHNQIKLEGQAEIEWKCVGGGGELLMARLNFRKLLLLWVLGFQLDDNCHPVSAFRATSGGYELGLVVQQGEMLMDNAIDGQTLRIHTDLGTATTGKPGAFAAGYDPQSQTAVFQSFSTPLVIDAKSGGSLALLPAHQVELTAAGFGPVRPLPQLFLPVAIR